ncbi:hypothetical protein W02_23020 [Nitrospira sp. KM1]|uniref:TPM domain-containing protein n=1 Tax=Nitrospira sp. KM1 TaxID=1936990 RepID=UPI0013A75B72|nr:TPM domain-containing protein [Nitrospira sp. KM1]BCA55162.1 hypothetical protein W02_23020 [Nitrospira sp. KM1]
MIGKTSHLTQEDRLAISEAVQKAERRTRAEIVPMVVSRSGLYRESWHWAGFSVAMLVLSLLLALETSWLPWGWHQGNAAWLLLATMTGYIAGSWVGRRDAFVRLLTSAERMRQKVQLRAERAFVRHGIGRTSDRNGVLILVSLLEHQVYVMPDQGIGSSVPSDQWQSVAEAVVRRLKQGDLCGGLCDGIEQCGVILSTACPLRSGENPNELPDRLIEEP